ncbi:MAG: hypothetical protein APR53_02140 [Methanoculleus sp. SDB]|nr:MAG: hypothetical protein APR53_02140 [Methanoculleus sp. SDB]
MPDAPPVTETVKDVETEKEIEIRYAPELDRISASIEAFADGKCSHVAVISDPFAGQAVLIDEIRKRYGDRIFYFSFESVVSRKDFIATIRRQREKDIIIIDRCHFLALRRIGGFDLLDEFLHLLTSSRKLFVTTWNSYTWSYLDSVRNISAYFPEVIHLPQMDVPMLKSIILGQYSGEIQFVDDTPRVEKRFISVTWKEAEILKRTVRYPYFGIHPEYLGRSAGTYDSVAAEDIIFRRIQKISEGNLGIALKIWENSFSYPHIRASSIPDAQCIIDLTVNEAFLLLIILSMDSIHTDDLREIAGPEMEIEKVLYRLHNLGLVEEKDGLYTVQPEALNCSAVYLKRMRMVW